MLFVVLYSFHCAELGFRCSIWLGAASLGVTRDRKNGLKYAKRALSIQGTADSNLTTIFALLEEEPDATRAGLEKVPWIVGWV
jgi:hypothetical protein